MSRDPNNQADDRAARPRDEYGERYDERSDHRPRRDERDERYDRRPQRSGVGSILLSIFGTIAVIAVVGFLARGALAKLLVPQISIPSILPTAGPTPTPTIITGAAVIRQIQHLNRLETNKYTIETVVEADKPGGFLNYGAEKLLLIAHGKVVAGIDLGKLQLQDITVSPDGKTIDVRLPAVEIFDTSLDEQQTRVYDRQSGVVTRLLSKPDPDLESQARQKGVLQILKSACEDGILDQAAKDGKLAITQLLSLSGFNSVQVEIASPATSPCAAATSATATP